MCKIDTKCETLHKIKAIEQRSGVKSTWNPQVHARIQKHGPMHTISTKCETLHKKLKPHSNGAKSKALRIPKYTAGFKSTARCT